MERMTDEEMMAFREWEIQDDIKHGYRDENGVPLVCFFK